MLCSSDFTPTPECSEDIFALRMKGNELNFKVQGGFKTWATNGSVRLVIRCIAQKIAGMISLLLYVH